MNINEAKDITTQDEARQFAIDWQAWASNQSLAYSELAEWQTTLAELADRYDLTAEFEENGII